MPIFENFMACLYFHSDLEDQVRSLGVAPIAPVSMHDYPVTGTQAHLGIEVAEERAQVRPHSAKDHQLHY